MITTDEDLSYQISDVRKTTEKSKVQYLACFFSLHHCVEESACIEEHCSPNSQADCLTVPRIKIFSSWKEIESIQKTISSPHLNNKLEIKYLMSINLFPSLRNYIGF